VNCGFNVGGIFVINLIIFCTFVLHFYNLQGNCVLSVCLYIVAFKCSLSNWPCNCMERYYHYIQEKITHVSFKNFFFNNYFVIIDVYRRDCLLYLLCFYLLFVKLFYIFYVPVLSL
jgi:hypothetical protein